MSLVRTALIIAAGCTVNAQDDPGAWLDRGIQAFKKAQYAEAARDFEQALVINPESVRARLYLGTAYMVQYIPGAQSPENVALGKKAEENFRKAVQIDPRNKTAITYLASLAFQQASALPPDRALKLDEARHWYEKLISVDPEDKNGFYSLGVIDWLEAYPQWQTARAQCGMQADDRGPLPKQQVKWDLRAKIGPLFEDGIRQLQRALQIDPKYDDAMAYMNLIVREKADLVDTGAEYDRDIQEADAWVRKALETKKANSEAVQGRPGSCPPRTVCFDPAPGQSNSKPHASDPYGPLTRFLTAPPPPPPPPPPPSR